MDSLLSRFAPPLIAGGKLVISPDGSLTIHHQLNQATTRLHLPITAITQQEDFIAVITVDGSVYRLGLGLSVWRLDIPSPVAKVVGGGLGISFYLTVDGDVYVYDRRDMEEIKDVEYYPTATRAPYKLEPLPLPVLDAAIPSWSNQFLLLSDRRVVVRRGVKQDGITGEQFQALPFSLPAISAIAATGDDIFFLSREGEVYVKSTVEGNFSDAAVLVKPGIVSMTCCEWDYDGAAFLVDEEGGVYEKEWSSGKLPQLDLPFLVESVTKGYQFRLYVTEDGRVYRSSGENPPVLLG